jgi:predicted GNAT family N-acyltransferase
MTLSASVVASHDALAKSFAIRSAVFIAEQKCPYDEEFDGNDFCSTHVLGFVDGEPAGTMRVRWFSDFAKFERVCVLSRFRNTELAREMMNLSFEIARRKGYRKVYGHAQARLVPYWEKYGFKPIQKNTKLVFSDHEYVEVICEMDEHPEAITLASDPYIVLRPEGAWDEPGVLDGSAQRAATNPH